ncbi:MAG: cysteine desulfurase [Gammaproteobacteria bacterium]|nr:cysteine desulfurase [Gammaproteobacteria bacterium]
MNAGALVSRSTLAQEFAARRVDFPILAREVHGKPLAYLDNAATAQKPRAVIDAVRRYYESQNSNIHRGVHTLSEEATTAYERARDQVRDFLHAADRREIVFVRGTTEAINLVAQSWGSEHLGPGDEVLVSTMEHHANIVPWQLVCERTGARLRVIPIDDDGDVDLEAFERLLCERTRLFAIVQVSNALGTVNPVAEMVARARARGIVTLVDGAQAVPHMQVDVRALGCDFYAFSGHKLFGPTGIGVLYGRAELLDAMPPYQGGGDMIRMVSFEKSLWNDLPYKFEAGTPNIAGTIGLGAALEYVAGIGLDSIGAWEAELLEYATARAHERGDLRLIGTARHKASVLSFVMDRIHPHDLGTILDREGVAIRTGHHCAMPVMERYGVPATARASFAFYNTFAEIDALFAGLDKARQLLG